MVGRSRHTGLNGFHQTAEKLVGRTFYEDKDIVGALLLKLLGIGIELEPAGIGGFHDCLAGFIADIGLIIEYT